MNENVTSGGMSLERFTAIVEAYGASPDRWPAAEREAALTFSASLPEARQLQSDAASLDELLSAVPMAEVSSTLVENILAAAPRATGAVAAAPRSVTDRIADVLTFLWPQTGFARPAGVLAASLTIGFFVGFSGPGNPAVADTQDEDLFAYVFGAPIEDDWNPGEWE